MARLRSKEGPSGVLTERYLNYEDYNCPSKGSIFGKPFRFGMPLPLTFNRSLPDYLVGPQWHCLDYLDPARAWRKGQQSQPPAVKASVTNHLQQRGSGQEQLPPAAVTISKVPALAESGSCLNRVSGVSVREYGAVGPLGLDGSFMVYERLEPPEVRRRIAAEGHSLELHADHLSQRAQSGMGPLQRVLHAWAEEDQAERHNPGPGHYNVDGTCSSDSQSRTRLGDRPTSTLGGPAYTMGARTRPAGQSLQEREAALAPGPGQYEISGSGPSGPAYTIKGKLREQPPESAQVPGPGAYQAEVPSVGVGPAYTIAGRTRDVHDEHIPGPGDYDVARSTNSGPAYTIVPRAKLPPIEVLPGPADYQKVETAPVGPAYTIAARPDPKPAGSDLPAPGEYELPEAWKEGPAYSIASRTHKEATRDILPGPGQYSQPKSPDGPAYSFAGRPPKYDPPESPGPTEYQQTVLPPSGPAYSMAGRPISSTYAKQEEAMLPGPGQYTIPSSPSAPAYTMAGRTALPDSSTDSPGPAAYGLPPDPCHPSAPAYTMAPRVAIPDEVPDSPGPAEYQESSYMPGGPAYTMAGRPAAKEDVSDHPAPGEYNVDSSGSRGPAYSIPQAGASGPKLEGPASPGPGEYEVHLPPQGPAYTIATSGRPQQEIHDSYPGPGDYFDGVYALGNRGPAYTIAGRPDMKPPKAIAPGPGEYEAPLSPSGPAYTIAPRIEPPTDKQDPVVGPGHYYPQLPSSAPAYTMAPRHGPPRDKSQDHMPGPGAYGDMPSPRGPAYTMAGPTLPGKSLLPGADSPGPAAYAVQELGPDGPAYTMAGRPKEPKASKEPSGPGPGEYGGEPTQPDGPAYTMQGRYRAPEPPATPGPGDYTQPLKPPEGPAYTIAPKLPSGQAPAQDSPAPGAYGSPGQDLIGQSGPAYTMAGRKPAGPEQEAIGPGPGEYGAGPSSPAGPAWTLGARSASAMPKSPGTDSPGPGAYAPAIAPDGPAFTLGARVNVPTPNDENPAPGDYGAPGPAGPSGPAYTLGVKAREPDPRMGLLGPGPGEHQAVLLPPEGPAFTLGKRSKRKAARPGSPAPGQYYRAPGPNGPAYTLAPRHTGPQPWANTTAPGDYTDPVADAPNGPAFTLRPKHVDPQPDMQPGPGQYDFSHFTNMPPTSSILKTRPQGRAEYLVSQFAFGASGGASGGAGLSFTGRPGVRRKVSFTDDTCFRDSTEEGGKGPQHGVQGPGIRVGVREQQQAWGGGAGGSGVPRPRSAQRPRGPTKPGSLLAGLYGYGLQDAHGPQPAGVGDPRSKGSRQSYRGGTGTGLGQNGYVTQHPAVTVTGGVHPRRRPSSAPRGAPTKQGQNKMQAAAASATQQAGRQKAAWGRGRDDPGLLAYYTTQPAGSSFTFSPPRPSGKRDDPAGSCEGFIGAGHQNPQKVPQLRFAQPAPAFLSGVIEAQQRLNHQVDNFGAGTAAAKANAQKVAHVSGAAGMPVVGIGRDAQSGAGVAEQKGGRQAKQPPAATVVRTEASSAPQPMQRPQQQQPQQLGDFAFHHASRQGGNYSAGEFAFDVPSQTLQRTSRSQ